MELIEREWILRRLRSHYNRVAGGGTIYTPSMMLAITDVERAPTIDAAPVVHGSWEEVDWVEPDGHGFGTVRVPKAGLMCNQCANVFKKKLLWKDNYCPNCGARMDGGEDDG